LSLNTILAALQSIPPFRRSRTAKRRARFRPQLDSLDGRIVPSFTPAVNYAVGDGPLDVATGDFNKDGRAVGRDRRPRAVHAPLASLA
jgi:hypothetical protein